MLISLEEDKTLSFLDAYLVPDGLANFIKNNEKKVAEMMKSLLAELNNNISGKADTDKIKFFVKFVSTGIVTKLRTEIFISMKDNEGIDSELIEKLSDRIGQTIILRLMCAATDTKCVTNYHVAFNTKNKKRAAKAQKALRDIMEPGDTIETKNDKA